jgi:zinc protease
MHLSSWQPLNTLAICLVVGCSASHGPAAPPVEFDLPNGLHVILRPIGGAQQTAVVTLFSIGGDHDPAGASGLAHYVEHLYVTAATSNSPARTTEQFMREYPVGWNAQTGDDYTVFATVVPPSDVDAEITNHAQRMGTLQIAEADLHRELPRIDDELKNMFGRIPALGASNLARERVRPTPHDGRKGGRIEPLRGLTTDQLQKRWQQFYKPANAVVVVAGAFDPAEVKREIATAFGDLPQGEPVPAAKLVDEPTELLPSTVVSVEPLQPTMAAGAAMAFRAPAPTGSDYAPFLVLVNRLLSQSSRGQPQAATTGPMLRYSFLDDPNVLFVTAELKPDETPAAVESRLREFVDEALTTEWNAIERTETQRNVAFFLDTMAFPDQVFAQNSYGAAFGAGRRHQLGIDGKKLARQLDRVTAAAVGRVGNDYLAPDCGATVVTTPNPR